MDDASKEVARFRNNFIDQLNLSIHPIIGKFIIPKIEQELERFSGLHLDYHLKTSREATIDVLEGKSDLAIVADPQKYPELIIKPLWREYIGLYSHDGKAKEKILFNSQMIFANKTLSKIKYSQAKQIDDYPLIYSTLKRSNYMGLLPNPIAEAEKKLKLIQQFKPAIDISLIYRSGGQRNKSLQCIISIIKNCSIG